MTTEHELKEEQETITIHVHFLGATQRDVGMRNLTTDIESLSNLKDLLLNLANKIGVEFQKFVFDPNANDLNENIAILVNGRHFNTLDGLETPLKTGDDVSFFPPIGGG